MSQSEIQRFRGDRTAVHHRFAIVWSVLLCSALLVGCGGEIKVDDGDIVLVGREDFRAALEKVDPRKENHIVVVDPRTEARYRERHLVSAINIPLPRARADDARIKKAKIIFVYGEYSSDPLAKAMCKKLLFLGYEDVRMYEGGLEDWRTQNLPLVEASDEN